MADFVIVCGPPASGKSTLAALLSRELRLPVISKDAIKERLMDRFGGGSTAGEAAFDVQFGVARELLHAGSPFILEGAFFRNQEPLAELASMGRALVIEVTCDLATVERRYVERVGAAGRHPGHRGVEALPDLRRRVENREYGVPIQDAPLLHVDTTDGLRPAESEIVDWVRDNFEPRGPADLRAAWDEHASEWIRWAREPGHDSYWRFARDAFFAMLPPPGGLMLDLGCGEGRVSRDLAAVGHHVIGLDGSIAMARAAHEAAPDIPVLVADGAHLPIAGDSFDLVVAYMTLHDFDDMVGAAGEIARVLAPGGRLCLGVVHPINSAGNFIGAQDGAAFVIEEPYFQTRKYVDRIERDGLTMTFASRHHTFAEYFDVLADAGLAVEAIREVPGDTPRWRRVPMFLFMRAVKR